MLDALVVGGGMCGQTAAFALLREGVRNIAASTRAARTRRAVGDLSRAWTSCARPSTSPA
jgi:cation diffusion facilitator CzcD-associated flavoprotein CzcO